jgi:hypothetical protein
MKDSVFYYMKKVDKSAEDDTALERFGFIEKYEFVDKSDKNDVHSVYEAIFNVTNRKSIIIVMNLDSGNIRLSEYDCSKPQLIDIRSDIIPKHVLDSIHDTVILGDYLNEFIGNLWYKIFDGDDSNE